jgi:HK97 family phage prohead protease
MAIKRKNNLRMEIKEISADGSFTGMLSVYNVIDLGKDLVEPGAFTKTIKDHGNEVPMLWQHKPDVPIGMLTLEDGPDALTVKGQLLLDLPEAKKAYLLIKARIVRGLSIGFDTVKEAMDGGIRRLKELRLYEGSIVTFPMNEAAQITSVKHRAERKEDFTTELAELQLQDAGYQMWCALRNALCSIPWSGLSREEKLAAAAATLEQFTAAWMDYLPAYLDWLTEEYGDMETASRKRLEAKALDLKAGRKISAATKSQITQAHEHMKNASDLLIALLESEADDVEDDSDDEATSKSKAAADTKLEPVPYHSAALSAATSLLDSIKAMIPA